MDLMCNEGCPSSSVQRTFLDKNLIKDSRVLERLLKIEDHYIPKCDYFKIVQKEIKPFMRKLVVTWMFEVSIFLDKQVFIFDNKCFAVAYKKFVILKNTHVFCRGFYSW